MKHLVYRKLVIPANVQPFEDPSNYKLIIDKGTEELTIMFTRFAQAYNIYLGANTPNSIARDFQDEFGNIGLSSLRILTFRYPTLFHRSINWSLYIDPVQPQEVTVEYVSLINDSYIYS